MDMNHRFSTRINNSYNEYSTQKVTQKEQLNVAVNQVSEHKDVQGNHPHKVAGSATTQNVNVRQYRAMFEGVKLPVLPQPVHIHTDQKSLEAFQAATGQISPEDQKTSADETETNPTDKASGKDGKDSDKIATSPDKKSVTGEILTEDEQAEVTKLQQRDREVKTHEQAHVSAGGQHIRGGIKYEYQKGPDGRDYAVGGHVNIDVSEAGSPEATITKMQQVKRAALAPAEPSSADRAVASEAASKEQKARQELAREQQENMSEAGGKASRVKIGGSRRKEAQAFEQQQQVKTAQQARADRKSQVQAVPEPPRAKTTMGLSAQSRIKNLSFWR